MSWVKKIIDVCSKSFNCKVDSNGSILINDRIIKVVGDQDLFSIKIIDLNRYSKPKQIDDIFYDDLQLNLEKTLKELS